MVRALDSAHRLPQTLAVLPVEQYPNDTLIQERVDSWYEPLDGDSIEMFAYRGGLYYHPVKTAQRCLEFLAAFRATKDQRYVDRGKRCVQRLLIEADRVGDAIFFPYRFDFAIHQDSANMLRAPWYSGMAQGEILRTLVRLYKVTGETKYLAYADSTFRAFFSLRGQSNPWVSRIDAIGYYWIEEYPHDDRPGMTLNGFIYAVYGVYNYYCVTEDPDAKLVWDLSLTTLKHYLPSYRRDGQTSYYCLGHMDPATETYHALHTQMMGYLEQMNGDTLFTRMKEAFEGDVR